MPSGSEEEDFLISSINFLLFLNYLPLEKGRALHMNKLESTSPKDALCQVWLKLASGSGGEDINVKSLRQRKQQRRQRQQRRRTTDKL